MVRSMTGYGKCGFEFGQRKVSVEIRTLNSKQLDINTRIPNGYREKEMEIRSMLSTALNRGKVDLVISIDEPGDMGQFKINRELLSKYHQELKELSDELDQGDFNDYLPVLMRMPEVLVPQKESLDPAEWELLRAAVDTAIEAVNQTRSEEGKILMDEFVQRNRKIRDMINSIAGFEKERIESIKTRMRKDLGEAWEKENIDRNRFEQELVYYIDKLDITEEKVRLRKHCEYFGETLEQPESHGKKLIFITQEMGREINTLGAKAYDAAIQKIVVNMKDELEKIREQLYNIL